VGVRLKPAVEPRRFAPGAFEILVSGHEFDGELAEQYGYVNRAIPDEQFVDFVDCLRPASCPGSICSRSPTSSGSSTPRHFPPTCRWERKIDAFWKASERPALS